MAPDADLGGLFAAWRRRPIGSSTLETRKSCRLTVVISVAVEIGAIDRVDRADADRENVMPAVAQVVVPIE
jgi:hypothetical protein